MHGRCVDLLSEHVVSCAASDLEHLRDEVFGDIEIGDGFGQIFGYGVEMAVVEAPFDEVSMAIAHVLSGVIVRSSEGHGEEGALLVFLLVHIHIVEEFLDAVVV